MLDGPVVAGVVFVVGAALVGAYLYIDHVRHARSHARDAKPVERLPLFGVDQIGAGADSTRPDPLAAPRPRARAVPRPMPVRPTNGSSGYPPTTAQPPFAAPTTDAGVYPPPVRSPYEPPHPGARYTPAPFPGAAGAARPAAASDAGPWRSPATRSAFADGETVRFALPDDGTLQFLPGRLEVIAGPDAGREVRFVRSPDSNVTDVTFGRSEGPPHRHVQLLARTVSRRHAVMTLLDEHWSLQNLSATNPVVINGRALAPEEVVPLLVDGDRIEMGEVVFVFHSR